MIHKRKALSVYFHHGYSPLVITVVIYFGATHEKNHALLFCGNVYQHAGEENG
ncbi:hypothetical protein FORC066_0064 [Yersinia enterocolitica]|nr:hypothetical protein FORC066_0064 [Yersinia enterocolitica]